MPLPKRQPTDAEGDETGAEAGDAAGSGDVDPWSFVSLSGAKVLAQHAQISYRPGVKRKALIEKLQEAGVQPPAPPADPDADDEE
jgi:hypothetical protein